MENDSLYRAIFRRKSVRTYILSPLPAATLADIAAFAHTLQPLDEGIEYDLLYLGMDDVKNPLPIKAPHYVCLYSEKKGAYLMNAGFLLQQLDLYLSANNLASCWLGMAKPSKQVPSQKDGLEFVIMLAFGQGAESVHREDRSSFRRKNYADISSIPNAEELLEPVRIAPSASNTQPWFFSGTRDEIIVNRKKLNLIKAPLYGRINQIDIGIALYHLQLSLNHEGKDTTIAFQGAEAPAGHEFMALVKTGG